MIRKVDIITVDVTDKILYDAVHYAEKSLHFTFNRMGKSDRYERVRNIVKGLAMEGSFQHLLDQYEVAYELLGHTHWTKKDRYDVGIDGHRYDVKGSFVSDYAKASALKKNVAWLLDCSALVPADQIDSASLQPNDFYVFPFMTGEVEKLHNRELFTPDRLRYLIHVFWDYAWIKNRSGDGLGHLTIQSHLEKNLHFRIGGQDNKQESLVEEFIIHPGAKVTTKNEYFTVLFTQSDNVPDGNLAVSAEKLNRVESIDFTDWRNIWIYDAKIYFTGLLSKKQFRNKSREIPRFYKRCKQYSDTLIVNRELLVNDLNPIGSILPQRVEMAL